MEHNTNTIYADLSTQEINQITNDYPLEVRKVVADGLEGKLDFSGCRLLQPLRKKQSKDGKSYGFFGVVDAPVVGTLSMPEVYQVVLNTLATKLEVEDIEVYKEEGVDISQLLVVDRSDKGKPRQLRTIRVDDPTLIAFTDEYKIEHPTFTDGLPVTYENMAAKANERDEETNRLTKLALMVRSMIKSFGTLL